MQGAKLIKKSLRRRKKTWDYNYYTLFFYWYQVLSLLKRKDLYVKFTVRSADRDIIPA